jgi:hypothetical protein
VQRALGVVVTGQLDVATRAALVRYKQEQGLLPADDSLNADLLKRLDAN